MATPKLLLLTVLIVLSSQAYGEQYLLKGQITDGETLFPPKSITHGIPWEIYGDPPSGFPIDYSAELEINTETDDWRFEFVALDDELRSHAIVTPSLTKSTFSNSVFSVVDSLQIGNSSWWQNFSLEIDHATQTGVWDGDSSVRFAISLIPCLALVVQFRLLRLSPSPTQVA